MKGIILAGGRGTRMYPMTKTVSKQLLPVYDKPMIYYPLSVLLLAQIREVLVITTSEDIEHYRHLLGDGSALGISIAYKIQKAPRGLAEAFLIGEDFIGMDSVCLILGDNIFYGQDFSGLLRSAQSILDGAVVFGYPVKEPSAFAVLEFDEDQRVCSIEEKPVKPKSSFAVPGLYFYDNDVIEVAKTVRPSARGELEITSVNQTYLERKKLKAILMGRGMAWLDTGTPSAMLKAAEFVEAVQERQGYYISCIEEIAWRRGFISKEQMRAIGRKLSQTEYGQYLLSL